MAGSSHGPGSEVGEDKNFRSKQNEGKTQISLQTCITLININVDTYLWKVVVTVLLINVIFSQAT